MMAELFVFFRDKEITSFRRFIIKIYDERRIGELEEMGNNRTNRIDSRTMFWDISNNFDRRDQSY